MKRYTTKLNITFTTSAKNKEDARYKFIMSVLNHINLSSAGTMKIDMSDNEFKKWEKKTKELAF